MEIRVQFYNHESSVKVRLPPDYKTRICNVSYTVPFQNFKDRKFWTTERVETLTLDEEILFSNQINTEKHRIFDYCVTYFLSKSMFFGHWIFKDDLEKVNELRRNRYVCGFCNFQTEVPQEHEYFCPKCLGSEFLREEDLYLTRLVSLSEERNKDEKIPENILSLYNIKQNYRLQVEKERALLQIDKDIKELRKKKNIISSIYDLGIDYRSSSLIYYGHKDTLSLRYPNGLKGSEKKQLKEKLKDFTLCKVEIE